MHEDKQDSGWSRCQAAVFKGRGLLMVPPMAFLSLCFHWEWEKDYVIWPVGLLVFALGLGLRFWAQRHLRYRLPDEKKLAVAGPYAWVRNPVYVGNLLMFAALGVLCELLWTVPLVCGYAFLLYHLAVLFEEQRLTKRYGQEYLAYRRKVGRWWPRRPAPTGFSSDRLPVLARVLGAEWQCALLLAIPILKEAVSDMVGHAS